MLSPKAVAKIVDKARHDLAIHQKTLDILEGNLEPYILNSLARTLSARVYAYAVERLVPINIIPRYVEKLANIYQQGVTRQVVGGQQSDVDLLSWYAKEFDINYEGHIGNKLYNACKSTLWHPYMTANGPRLRVIPNDRFVVYSTNDEDPRKPTGVILLAGKNENGKEIYWVYDKDSFVIYTSDEMIDRKSMMEMGNPDGVNPYGVLPFVYINSSSLRLWPVPDKDSLRMAEFVPVSLTDLNLAAMFSAFSITYITNGSAENAVYAPNALWFLKSDDPEKDVQIGTLKPQVDYQEVLNLIQSEMSMWLASKGIKAGSIGNLTVENSQSGIAKMIDEADTYDVRRQQTIVFSKAEQDLWDLVLRYMHPVWVSQGMVSNRATFSMGAEVDVKFTIMPVGQARKELIDEQMTEYGAGFTTRKRAVHVLNPQMTQSEVDELLMEIEEERSIPEEQNSNDDEVAENQDTATDSVET